MRRLLESSYAMRYMCGWVRLPIGMDRWPWMACEGWPVFWFGVFLWVITTKISPTRQCDSLPCFDVQNPGWDHCHQSSPLPHSKSSSHHQELPSKPVPAYSSSHTAVPVLLLPPHNNLVERPPWKCCNLPIGRGLQESSISQQLRGIQFLLARWLTSCTDQHLGTLHPHMSIINNLGHKVITYGSCQVFE